MLQSTINGTELKSFIISSRARLHDGCASHQSCIEELVIAKYATCLVSVSMS